MKNITHTLNFPILLIIVFSLNFISCKKEDVDIEHKIEILFPNEGGVFVLGGTYLIKWKDEKSSSVRIKLYYSGKLVSRITDNTPNNGEYAWTCPDSLSAQSGYTIKVFSNDDDFTFTESEMPFTIIDSPKEYSSFIDIRDGQEYKTVKINNQWWMAQNFNYGNSYDCYNHDSELCLKYGSLYTYETARDLAPAGWHLPSDNEWKDLELYLGVSLSEIDEDGYRGINTGLLLKEGGGIGFNAKYSGYKSGYNLYYGLEEKTSFWTSTRNTRNYVWARELSISEVGVKRYKAWGYYYSFSVRYVKDY